MNEVDNLKCKGTLDVRGDVKFASDKLLQRQYLRQEDAASFAIPLTDFKISTTGQPLTATPSGSDLGLVAGTFGTGNFVISAGDVGGDGTTTRYARAVVRLRPEYVAGQPVKINIAAGMVTTIADASCHVDVEAYKVGRDALVDSSDLITTTQEDINDLAFDDFEFTVTPTGLQPGDELDVRIKIVCVDAATVAAVKPTIAAVDLLCSIKG